MTEHAKALADQRRDAIDEIAGSMPEASASSMVAAIVERVGRPLPALVEVEISNWPDAVDVAQCGAQRENAVGPYDESHGCVLNPGHEVRGEYAFNGKPYHMDSTGRLFPAIVGKP